MKRIKLMLIICGFMIFPLFVNANSIENIDMNILISDNGDAKVTEKWTVDTSDSTEIYKPYYNMGNSEITNFSVTMDDINFQTLDSWNISASFNDKKYKAGINDVSEGVELCFGISEYGHHTYTMSYNITKFVKSYNDAQLIYNMLIPNNMNSSPKYVKITINKENGEFPSESLTWGYGWQGIANFSNNQFNYEASDGISSSRYMVVLIKFPSGTFETTDTINKTFEEVFNQAEDGVDLSNYKSSKSSLKAFLETIITVVFPFLICVVSIALGLKYSNKFSKVKFKDKKLPKNKDLHYFRDIPCNKDLSYAYWIAMYFEIIKKKENIIGAYMLNWIDKKYIKIIKDGKNTKFDFTTDFECQTNAETELKNMIVQASGEDKILEKKELQKWVEKNYKRFNKWFTTLQNEIEKSMIENNLINVQGSALLGNSKIKEEAINLAGLKKYLLEYSLIKDRMSEEVALWNEYLIFAQVLGIADKVAKEIGKINPDYIENNLNYDYTDLYFINSLSRSAVYGAEARLRAERMNSGGGGFSSFGGGGGSFGGGSGGGGFR